MWCIVLYKALRRLASSEVVVRSHSEIAKQVSPPTGFSVP
jgi:hypothetical protein